jgi:hypothetical protein
VPMRQFHQLNPVYPVGQAISLQGGNPVAA